MRLHLVAGLAGTLLCAFGAVAAAQTLSAEDFARRAELHSVSLSPGGGYVAIAVPTENGMETRLNIVSLDGTGHTQVLRFGPQQHVSDILWTSDEQLVVSRAKLQPLKATPESYGELMSSDVNGKNQEVLFAYVPDRAGRRGRRKDKGFADVAFVLPNDPGKVMVRFRCWRSMCGEEPPTTIYRVDTRTGERQEVERVGEPAWFGFDQTGRARILVTWDDEDQPVLRYRPGASAEWLPMPKALVGRTIDYAWFAADGNTAFLTVSDHGEPAQLYKVDFAAGTRTRLAGRDDVDIARVMRTGFTGEPFAVVYDEDKPSFHYLDPASEWARMHTGLLKQFPGHMVTLLDSTRDGNKVLFSAWSGRDPGGWYLFDRAADKLQLVAPSRPWIDPREMAPVRPISFKARDGSTLHGFLTGSGTGPQPLVVMPHGGPFGPYDSWQFDAQAQFLASRGYSVLQVNYRGSGGRGESLMKSAYQEWGGLIQDDIADGVRWAIAEQLADPERICTFGASFGGGSLASRAYALMKRLSDSERDAMTARRDPDGGTDRLLG